MNSKEINETKKSLHLSKIQREILVGLLLGDGCLETQNGGRTYRLKVEHSEAQKDYVMWLYGIFKDWVPSGIYQRVRREKYSHVGFQTYSHGSFRFYGKQFYPEGQKIIPKIVEKLLSPLAIAVWFMDDGSRKSREHKTFIFHTYCFTKKDLEILQGALLNKFGIKSTLQAQKEQYWRLYIKEESAEVLRQIISPIVEKFSSMKHKLTNTNA